MINLEDLKTIEFKGVTANRDKNADVTIGKLTNGRRYISIHERFGKALGEKVMIGRTGNDLVIRRARPDEEKKAIQVSKNGSSRLRISVPLKVLDIGDFEGTHKLLPVVLEGAEIKDMFDIERSK